MPHTKSGKEVSSDDQLSSESGKEVSSDDQLSSDDEGGVGAAHIADAEAAYDIVAADGERAETSASQGESTLSAKRKLSVVGSETCKRSRANRKAGRAKAAGPLRESVSMSSIGSPKVDSNSDDDTLEENRVHASEDMVHEELSISTPTVLPAIQAPAQELPEQTESDVAPLTDGRTLQLQAMMRHALAMMRHAQAMLRHGTYAALGDCEDCDLG
jgi:hypothetical protein